MKELFKRLKIIDHLTTELRIGRTEFVDKLQAALRPSGTGIWGLFTSEANELKGRVDYEGFRIRKRRGNSGSRMNFAVAKGTFSEYDGSLKIETEINGASGFFILYYVAIIIFYTAFFSGASRIDGSFFFTAFAICHACFMFGLPYFMIRAHVKRLKYELEREFYFLTRKEEQSRRR